MAYYGTFALFELPPFLWGTFVKNESKLLEMLKVLTELCLYIPTDPHGMFFGSLSEKTEILCSLTHSFPSSVET